MFVRVVRFTGVTEEQMGNVVKRIQESGGPPPGVESSAIKLMYDAAAGTAVVLQEFPTAQAMEEAAKIFDAMDTTDTPGTRASVDACEVKLEVSAG
jgi:hypothetical protein